MREIKFRALDRDKKEMIYGLPSSDTDFIDHLEIPAIMVSSTNDDDGYLCEIMEGTLGQYTGLKDENGKEIYEGDIVRTELGYAQIIVWSDMYAAFVAEYPNGDRPYRVDCTDEIIGNVHENKDLLEETP